MIVVLIAILLLLVGSVLFKGRSTLKRIVQLALIGLMAIVSLVLMLIN